MRELGPYNRDLKRMDATLPFQNERAEISQEGMIPAAEYFYDVAQELRNLVIASGQTLEVVTGNALPTNDQITKAVRGMNQLVENRTVNVPGDWPTLRAAMSYLSTVTIPNDVLITVAVGNHEETIDDLSLPILIDHPYGDRIQIVGMALQGSGFPTPTEVNNSSKTVVEALLRQRFKSIIKVTGQQTAFFQKSGSLRRIANIALIGDGSANQIGFVIGQWQGAIGSGNIRFENIWAFNIGSDGIKALFNSAIQGTNVGSSHNGQAGFRITNQSGIQIQGNWIAVRNGTSGIIIRDEGFADVRDNAYFNNNTLSGVVSIEGGNFQAKNGATVLEVKGNGLYGIQTSNASYSAIPSFTAGGGNASGTDVMTTAAAQAWVGSGHSLTLSPAANTLGNNNSINMVY